LFIEEARTHDAHEHLRGNVLVISDFAIAEFSSGVARRSRVGEINESGALRFLLLWMPGLRTWRAENHLRRAISVSPSVSFGGSIRGCGRRTRSTLQSLGAAGQSAHV